MFQGGANYPASLLSGLRRKKSFCACAERPSATSFTAGEVAAHGRPLGHSRGSPQSRERRPISPDFITPGASTLLTGTRLRLRLEQLCQLAGAKIDVRSDLSRRRHAVENLDGSAKLHQRASEEFCSIEVVVHSHADLEQCC